MKHTEWLRLQLEGENICAILRQNGYQCQKQARRLSWWVSKEGSNSYILTYITTPINSWSVFPNDSHPIREQLKGLVRNALASHNEKVTAKSQINGIAASETVPIKDSSQFKLVPDYDPRPWTIVRLLPDAQHYTVARFYNRQDANDHLRFLNRFIPAAEFEIVFDPPTM